MIPGLSGTVVSNRPVELKLLQGRLRANRLEVADAGDLVRFDGGVTMTLRFQDKPSAGDAAATAGEADDR